MEIGLSDYAVSDISGASSSLVSGSRRRDPIGTLIHGTDGTNSTAWLTGDSAKAGDPASANELIARSGATQILTTPDRYPYHAGKSRLYWGGKWYGGDAVSELLYGIELECLWAEAPTYQQYDALAARIVAMGIKYGWRWPYVIFGHYGVAIPSGRRSDPWLFDWGGFMGRLYVRAYQLDVPGLL